MCIGEIVLFWLNKQRRFEKHFACCCEYSSLERLSQVVYVQCDWVRLEATLIVIA